MHNRSLLHFTGILIILACFFCNASAQNTPNPGKRDSISSAVLKEKRHINVVLPDNYKPGSAEKYDVIYVLDGDENTRLMDDIRHFIQSENFMPPVIIVGVMNTDRNRDLTPTHENGFDTSGGAGNFLAFLKNELIPYITKTYPANGTNILWGHSFGGLFVTYALLNEPQTFSSYIAADPSFWWGNGYMIKQAASKLPALANLDKAFFITGREGQDMKEMAILPMDTLLQKYAPAGLAWKISTYPNETHGTVKLKSIYDGLRFVYEGYNTKGPEFHPMTGILLKNKPVKLWFFGDSTKVHYTTDGTIPLKASAIIGSKVTMPGPGTFTAKQFTGREKNDKITTGVFKEGNPLIPVGKAKGFKPGGFHYAYYEGQWDRLPDFTKLKPVKEGLADSSFNLSKLPGKLNYGLVISGQMEVKEEGYYIFDIQSDDGSRLYINDQLTIDNDGLHNDFNDRSCILPLKKGFYPFRLEYFQKDGGASLRLIYLTPRMLDTKDPKPLGIPAALQYSAN
ncbi:MAG TPA: alpha/beta hydrolase-fold protein [Mucilaginibacter sp.]|nr:alpha/beta hydrolase-fold protein [Mucilaginibacter sp.]